MRKKLKQLENEVNSLTGADIEVKVNPRSSNFIELKRLIEIKVGHEDVSKIMQYTPREFTFV